MVSYKETRNRKVCQCLFWGKMTKASTLSIPPCMTCVTLNTQIMRFLPGSPYNTSLAFAWLTTNINLTACLWRISTSFHFSAPTSPAYPHIDLTSQMSHTYLMLSPWSHLHVTYPFLSLSTGFVAYYIWVYPLDWIFNTVLCGLCESGIFVKIGSDSRHSLIRVSTTRL